VVAPRSTAPVCCLLPSNRSVHSLTSLLWLQQPTKPLKVLIADWQIAMYSSETHLPSTDTNMSASSSSIVRAKKRDRVLGASVTAEEGEAAVERRHISSTSSSPQPIRPFSSSGASSSGDEMPLDRWGAYPKRRKHDVVIGINARRHHPPSSPTASPTVRPAPPPAARLTVAVAQFIDRGSIAKNSVEIIQKIGHAAEGGAQVVVFHETATTGYFPHIILNSGRELRDCETHICNACRTHRIGCIVGTPHFSERHGTFRNTVLVVDDKGRRVCRQSKRQLVPTDDWAAPGNDMLLFRIAGTVCCAVICHDIRHPELVRLPVLRGARCVFYCSWETSHNDQPIDLGNEAELAVYRAQVQARAVENGVWIVHANAAANQQDRTHGSHGMSRIVNPLGHVIAEAKPSEETLIVQRLDMKLAKATYAMESSDLGYFLRDWYVSGCAYSNEVTIPPESPRLTPQSPNL
jgi:predicted amidohydrolase